MHGIEEGPLDKLCEACGLLYIHNTNKLHLNFTQSLHWLCVSLHCNSYTLNVFDISKGLAVENIGYSLYLKLINIWMNQ